MVLCKGRFMCVFCAVIIQINPSQYEIDVRILGLWWAMHESRDAAACVVLAHFLSLVCGYVSSYARTPLPF